MPLYFATETAKCSQIRAMCYPLQSEVSAHATKPFQLITPCTMDVNARHVNDYIREAVVYVPIMWVLYWTELGLRFLHVRWPVMEYWYVAAQWD